MTIRLYFKSTPYREEVYEEHLCEFKYFNGFATSQKQKSIKEFHSCIYKKEKDAKILEVSTKSDDIIGVKLSAFNLKFYDEVQKKEFAIENIFQSSKVFQNGGPYLDLLNVHPRDAKRDERLKNSGQLVKFMLHKQIWELEPKTIFYDWVYMMALNRERELSKAILDFNIFTDIEFNHNKSFNCQARSAAIFVSLSLQNRLEQALTDYQLLKSIYRSTESSEQISMI